MGVHDVTYFLKYEKRNPINSWYVVFFDKLCLHLFSFMFAEKKSYTTQSPLTIFDTGYILIMFRYFLGSYILSRNCQIPTNFFKKNLATLSLPVFCLCIHCYKKIMRSPYAINHIFLERSKLWLHLLQLRWLFYSITILLSRSIKFKQTGHCYSIYKTTEAKK